MSSKRPALVGAYRGFVYFLGLAAALVCWGATSPGPTMCFVYNGLA
jgi:hypothetical protein